MSIHIFNILTYLSLLFKYFPFRLFYSSIVKFKTQESQYFLFNNASRLFLGTT